MVRRVPGGNARVPFRTQHDIRKITFHFSYSPKRIFFLRYMFHVHKNYTTVNDTRGLCGSEIKPL